MKVQENLKAAATLIRAVGLARFTRYDRHSGSMCALGALAQITVGDPKAANGDEELAAIKSLGVIPPSTTWTALPENFGWALADWSNAEGRTAEEVACLFEKAAEN